MQITIKEITETGGVTAVIESATWLNCDFLEIEGDYEGEQAGSAKHFTEAIEASFELNEVTAYTEPIDGWVTPDEVPFAYYSDYKTEIEAAVLAKINGAG